MSDLVHSLESIIRRSGNPALRTKAVDTVLALVAGGFHTSLVSYFMHKDLFSALMKVCYVVSISIFSFSLPSSMSMMFIPKFPMLPPKLSSSSESYQVTTNSNRKTSTRIVSRILSTRKQFASWSSSLQKSPSISAIDMSTPRMTTLHRGISTPP